MAPSEDPFLNTLAEWLHKTTLPEKNCGRDQGTRKLNGALIEFCFRNHVHSAREVDLRIFHHDSPNWYGKLDWVLRPKRNAIATYAVEIDSCNKKKSLEKLLLAHQLHYVPVWVRWCADLTMEIPEEVTLIDLTASPVLTL